MAMTNAEKQAAFRAKREQEFNDLAEGFNLLSKENATLRAQLDAAQKKIHSLQIKNLKLKAK